MVLRQVKDAHHRGIVAKYCAKDCELVYRLIRRLDYLPQYLEMSKVLARSTAKCRCSTKRPAVLNPVCVVCYPVPVWC